MTDQQTTITEPPCACEPWERGNNWHWCETEYSRSPQGDLVILEYWQCEDCFESWSVVTIIPKTELDKYPRIIQP